MKSASDVAAKLLARRSVEGECWRWLGAHDRNGYGQSRSAGWPVSIHRASYMVWVGPIPEGLEIDHLCRVRDCFNPKHLEAVTHAENLWRREPRPPGKPGEFCRRGHPLAGQNLYVRAGRRSCRACAADSRARYRERRAASEQSVGAA